MTVESVGQNITPPPAANADVRNLVDGEDLDDSMLPALRGQELGVASFDSNNRPVRLPQLKIRQSNSGKVITPTLKNGDITLDLEHLVTSKDNKAVLVVLSYAQYYEDNVPLGAPKTIYPSLVEAAKAGKRIAQNGESAGTPNTVREAARAVLLVEKPDDIADSAFPFEVAGKRYAVARWYLNGWALWGPGRTIQDKSQLELRPSGLISGRFELTTAPATGKAGPFHKPFMRLLPERNSPQFVEAAKALFVKQAGPVAAAESAEGK